MFAANGRDKIAAAAQNDSRPRFLQVLNNCVEVSLERGEIDSRDGRTDLQAIHAVAAARFSNRVNSRMNANLTTPVGPLRCLPMISSAIPSFSGGGCVLSKYKS